MHSYNWDVTKFPRVPSRYWNDIHNQRSFMDNLAKTLHIDNQDDWYRMSIKTITQHGGAGMLAKHNNSCFKLLTTVYPEYLCCIVPSLYHTQLEFLQI